MALAFGVGVLSIVMAGVIAVILGLRSPSPSLPLQAEGTVEADEILLSPQVTSRLVGLPAQEGHRVAIGDVLARLDDALIQLQIRQADVVTRQQLDLEVGWYTLRSPITGTITGVPVHNGELVTTGETVVAVAGLAQLRLTVYVLERDLGRVQVGQRAQVAADALAGRTYRGYVTSIASQAEFTPRNVETASDRQNLVFAVKLLVDNADGALKPGMPVSVTFIS